MICSDAERAKNATTEFLNISGEVFVVAFAVVGGVMDDDPLLVLEAGHELGCDFVLIDHRAVDAVHFLVVVRVGHVRKDCTPHDDRQSKAVIDIDRTHRHRRAVMGNAGDDPAVGSRLGGNLHADVRLAFVIQDHKLIVVSGIRIGISQSYGEVGGIAAAHAVGGNTTGQRPNKHQLYGLLRAGNAAAEHDQQK